MKTSRDFSQTTIERISRKKSSKRLHSEKQNIKQHLHLNRSKRRRSKRMQSNVIHQLSSNRDFSSNVSRYRRSALSSNMSQTLINWKQNNINNNIQDNRISTPTKKEKSQLILSNLVRDCLPINSIINSTTYFDMSNTHRFLSRNHQINPINSEVLFKDDFILHTDERNRKKKKKKKFNLSLCKLSLCILILFLIIGCIIGVVIYIQQIQTQLLYCQVSMFNDLIAIANKISLTAVTTTTQTSVCTTGGITCPTPILSWSRTNNCTRSSSSYVYYSCCYLAVSTQLTIQFQLQEQVSHWYIDEVSMIQSNGELIINGGFESNLTGWTVIPSTNLSVTSYAHVAPGAARFGSAYLYSEAVSGPDYIKQTFNVVQGQNVNVSFWWLDEGGVGGANDICEGIVTLSP
ncbi:unnamed protein product [Rotaria sordida]|uniref:Uncharacterized protein n=1 Tax=Rotaria sordida TaxID=392033 RepID=A0A813WZI5_9BILA|nr:unnamed protein product [Rotaria sordida]CAF0862816.1 unnamed protein product [Rotaria sordida]CAF0906290.1 unnamed protein product [Rotaria sordida]CAF3610456.1 unnamed protein product [Rotaria sordida]CAF3713726.1 unnamed protein product [Rotaria sordida]